MTTRGAGNSLTDPSSDGHLSEQVLPKEPTSSLDLVFRSSSGPNPNGEAQGKKYAKDLVVSAVTDSESPYGLCFKQKKHPTTADFMGKGGCTDRFAIALLKMLRGAGRHIWVETNGLYLLVTDDEHELQIKKLKTLIKSAKEAKGITEKQIKDRFPRLPTEVVLDQLKTKTVEEMVSEISQLLR